MRVAHLPISCEVLHGKLVLYNSLSLPPSLSSCLPLPLPVFPCRPFTPSISGLPHIIFQFPGIACIRSAVEDLVLSLAGLCVPVDKHITFIVCMRCNASDRSFPFHDIFPDHGINLAMAKLSSFQHCTGILQCNYCYTLSFSQYGCLRPAVTMDK